MQDALLPEKLHRATISYYDIRQVHGDMPHKIPRGPAPDMPAEHARMVSESREAMRGRRVLEVASGTGTASREISETAASVTGVEVAPNMLRLARESEYPANVTYVAGDAFSLGSLELGRTIRRWIRGRLPAHLSYFEIQRVSGRISRQARAGFHRVHAFVPSNQSGRCEQAVQGGWSPGPVHDKTTVRRIRIRDGGE